MLDELMQDHRKLQTELGLPGLERAWLAQEVRTPEQPPLGRESWQKWIWSEIERFAPVAGWLALEERLVQFDGGGLPQKGVLLYGEVAKPGASMHVRPDGNGGWRVTIWSEPKAGSEGAASHLAQTDRYAAANPALGWLDYRVFWAVDAARGTRRVASRFVGFSK